MQRRTFILPVVLFVLFLAAGAAFLALPRSVAADSPPGTYVNPARIAVTTTQNTLQTFEDPAIIRAQDGVYYAYATTDPLGDWDRDPGGNLQFHHIPIAASSDLAHWTYAGDSFPLDPSGFPAYIAPGAGLWAPDVRWFNNQYYLYFTVTDTCAAGTGNGTGVECNHIGSSIGVATAPAPTGPWTMAAAPVVPPNPAPCCPGSARNTFDPFILDSGSQKYIYFGSYFGGISVRRLSADGLSSVESSQVQVTVANKYEAPYVVFHDGYYYLFASATNCCNGPLTGYSVFTGRASSPLGPFVDKSGVPLAPPGSCNCAEIPEGRAGGTVVLTMNGNRFVGPGHNAVISDTAGTDWIVYHAVPRDDPYFADPNPFNITKRPLMIDRLDWIDGWPEVNAGYGPSDAPMPAPVTSGNTPLPSQTPRPYDEPGKLLAGYSDDFDASTLDPKWSWVRESTALSPTLTERPGYFREYTTNTDLYQDNNSAPVLLENAPPGDFLVEVKFDFYLPPNGCCYNYLQAGMLLYENDDRFLKLNHFSNWDTRQTEWAKENCFGCSGYKADAPQAAFPRYGNTIVGPPAAPSDVPTTTTWLRIVKRNNPTPGEGLFTAYTSIDGTTWERGATWVHTLQDIKIGLIAFGAGSDLHIPADFDYVHVYDLATVANESPTTTATETGTPTTTETALPSSTATETAQPSSTATETTTAQPSSTATETAQPSSTATETTTALPSSTATAMPTEPYSDVGPGDYFYQAVNWLYQHGAISGYADGTFKPYNTATRAQIVKIVVAAAGLPLLTPEQATFSDVPASSGYFPFVETAYAAGIISGYNGSAFCGALASPCFKPDNDVTRGQIAKIVVVAAGWDLLDPATPAFADVPASDPFYKYIETAHAHYVISGYDCGTPEPCPGAYFRPGNKATRGQVAKIVYLALTTPAQR